MKLSRASSYALHALTHLARHNGTAAVAAHDMARATGAPEKFLLKLLKPLVSARVLHSMRGPHGGYRLARPAAEITLLDVVETVDGPLRAEAPQDSGDAAFDGTLQAVCEDVAERTRSVLSGVTLADLAAETLAAV
jgi:Rrf2 family protein